MGLQNIWQSVIFSLAFLILIGLVFDYITGKITVVWEYYMAFVRFALQPWFNLAEYLEYILYMTGVVGGEKSIPTMGKCLTRKSRIPIRVLLSQELEPTTLRDRTACSLRKSPKS